MSEGRGRVASDELVVVASWVPQRGQGGGAFVEFDGHLVGELLNKAHPFRVTRPSSTTVVRIRVRTTGVSRRHRKATFDFTLDAPADHGVLVVVSCAVGYLWPLIPSKPARVRIFSGVDLGIPRSHFWRVGFKQLPKRDSGTVGGVRWFV
jgi:hypothetical protein